VPFPHDKWPDNFVQINTLGLNNLNQVVGSWDNYSTPERAGVHLYTAAVMRRITA
jgi:hypothetical protein